MTVVIRILQYDDVDHVVSPNKLRLDYIRSTLFLNDKTEANDDAG